MARKYKYTQARQVGGDDGYCWAVFVNGRMKVNGLTRREVAHYRDRFEAEEAGRRAEDPERNPDAVPRSGRPGGCTCTPVHSPFGITHNVACPCGQ